MSDKPIDDGGPAMPLVIQESRGACGEQYQQMYAHNGMSLRDWFAGQALAGRFCFGDSVGEIAGNAYDLADAMLAARKQVAK